MPSHLPLLYIVSMGLATCTVHKKIGALNYGEGYGMARIDRISDYSNHPASQDSPLVVGNNKIIPKPDKGGNMNKNKPWVGFRFKNKGLEVLYTTGKGAHKYSEAVVKGFFKAMQKIAAAKHDQDLPATRSLKFHGLSGNRDGEYAVSLTGNWRLIMTIEEDVETRYLLIWDIEDYH